MRKTVFIVMLALLAPAGASQWQTPQWLGERADQWRLLGEGQLRWLGFRIYDAALWIDGEGRPDTAPFALELRYHRDIASDRLVQTSLDEMRRLGLADEAMLANWRADLEAAFPDVVAGDVIVGRKSADGSAEFYHRGERTVRIDDPAFAEAFFGIWLDEGTREPGLRAALLGRRDD